MTANMSQEDLFHVAERLEKHSAQFYRRAAALSPDGPGRKVLVALAGMEEEHQHVFSAMRRNLLKLKDPGDQGPLTSAQGRAVFDILLGGLMADLRGRFGGKMSGADILREAIEFEKDTIVFLAQLGEMVDGPAPKRNIQAILRQELTHLFTLSSQLEGERPARGGSAGVRAIT